MQALHPVECCSGIGKLALTVVEFTLAAPDPPEVEPQRGEIALHEHVEQIVDDLVVHGAAEFRMRVGMQHDGDRCCLVLGRLVAALQPATRAIENHFWHRHS